MFFYHGENELMLKNTGGSSVIINQSDTSGVNAMLLFVIGGSIVALILGVVGFRVCKLRKRSSNYMSVMEQDLDDVENDNLVWDDIENEAL